MIKNNWSNVNNNYAFSGINKIHEHFKGSKSLKEIENELSEITTYTLHKENKKIIIECETWQVTVKGNATINISGNANITASNVDVKANGNTNLTSTGVTTVTSSMVNINGASGAVMTDTLNPVVDFITGVPSIGVQNVRSG